MGTKPISTKAKERGLLSVVLFYDPETFEVDRQLRARNSPDTSARVVPDADPTLYRQGQLKIGKFKRT